MERSRTARGAFSLLEMLIFVAIFSVAIVVFISILVSFTRIQTRQSSQAEVNQQAQVLIQSLQYYVEHASVIDMTIDSVTSTLKLRMASSTDPTTVTLTNGTVYLSQGGGATQALTSNKVLVTALNFTNRKNPSGHNAIAVSFSIKYNATSTVQGYSQTIQTSFTRTAGGTFDSNISSAANNTYKIGANRNDWKSINGTLYFNNSTSVGIGVADPQQALEVNGGFRLNVGEGTAQPSCNASQATTRDVFWFVENSTSDAFQVCAASGSTLTFAWKKIF